MSSFKQRYDAFADAVIAIILTIMVMGLPVDVVNGRLDYRNLFLSIGIYAVSFFFVAAAWYRHTLVTGEAKALTNADVFLDFLFLLFLSLIPAFTRLMTVRSETLSVVLFGVDSLIVMVLQYVEMNVIFGRCFEDRASVRQAMRDMFGRIQVVGMVSQAVFTVVAIWAPRVSLVFFIIISIGGFVLMMRRKRDFDAVESLDASQTRRYESLSAADRRRFEHRMARYYRLLEQARDSSGSTEQRGRALRRWRDEADKAEGIGWEAARAEYDAAGDDEAKDGRG